jgi:hypothetical protein
MRSFMASSTLHSDEVDANDECRLRRSLPLPPGNSVRRSPTPPSPPSTASAEHRIAAVLALSATDPAGARRRAHIGAAASVAPDLRAALDEAAEGEVDDARLERLVAR